jgi:flagellar FliL protein
MAEEKSTEGKASNLGKVMVIAFVVVNICVSGGGLFLAYQSSIGWSSPKYTEVMAMEKLEANMKELENLPLVYTLEPFKANLDGLPVRAIEIEVSVEMMNRQGFEELIGADNIVKIRDSIIRILQSKSYDNLETVQGKLFLKDQVALSLNEILVSGVVKDVFFSQFKIE